MTRVVIAAASPVIRAGLEAMLARSPSIAVVGHIASVDDESLERALAEREPDVVLAAVDAEDRIAWVHDDVALVLLVPEADTARTMDALDALRDGARAVLPANASPEELTATIDAAAQGLAVLPVAIARASLNGSTALAASTGSSVLTPREAEVLRLVAAGLGNKTIAARLAISEHTVKTHVAALLAKLGVTTRAEAVAIGIRRGMIPV
jgi:DNA-binding NarL/FixJ family response regulator